MRKSSNPYNLNFDSTLNSIVSINTYAPDNSFSAELLGTERSGHGVVISDDGLIVTVGYILTEADSIWIKTKKKEAVQGYIVGNDFESGLGLIKAVEPLHVPKMACGDLKDLHVNDSVMVAGYGGLGYTIEASIVEIKEFAGRWEYILDEAIYTSPVHPNWAGAALIGKEGKLYGIGCLLIQEAEQSEKVDGYNMFIPVNTITPFIEEILEHGGRKKRPRPWLGMLVHDEEGQLIITGIFTGCPADQAGLKLGDIIISVRDIPVTSLANLFREIWKLGNSGVDVPLSIIRDGQKLEVHVISSDRESCFIHVPVN
jgi:S1-C subfamily serine protease